MRAGGSKLDSISAIQAGLTSSCFMTTYGGPLFTGVPITDPGPLDDEYVRFCCCEYGPAAAAGAGIWPGEPVDEGGSGGGYRTLLPTADCDELCRRVNH